MMFRQLHSQGMVDASSLGHWTNRCGCGTHRQARCSTPWRPTLNRHRQMMRTDRLSLAQMICHTSRLCPENDHPSSIFGRGQWTRPDTPAGCSPQKSTISCSCRLLHGCLTIPIFLPYLDHVLPMLTLHPQHSVLSGRIAIALRLRLLFITTTPNAVLASMLIIMSQYLWSVLRNNFLPMIFIHIT
jgi:hypothetical protein